MQSLRVGVTAGRISPKIRPNRFLGFSRGFHFLVAAPKIALQGCFRSSPFARCSLLSPLDKLETKMATVSVTW